MGFSPHLMSRIAGDLPVGKAAGDLAAFLPASSGYGFEWDLGSGRMDLSVRLAPADGSAALFRGPAAIESLCRTWDGVDVLWLEYDDPGPGRPWSPSLGFYRLSPVFASLDDDGAQVFLTGLMNGVGTGFAAPLACEVVQSLRPLVALRHLGFSLGRAQRDARLCFTVKRDDVAECLDRLRLDRQAAHFRPLLEELSDPDSLVVLHLDVGARLGERLGIEIAPARDEGWERMFSTLSAQGLCGPEALSALRRWPETPDGLRDPAPGLSASLPTAGWDQAILLRRLNHIKFSAMPGGPTIAKAYLYSGLLWDAAAMRRTA